MNGIFELIELVLKINKETELAAFFDISGHTNSFCVNVSVGKTGECADKEGYKVNKHSMIILESSHVESLDNEKIIKEYIEKLKILLVKHNKII